MTERRKRKFKSATLACSGGNGLRLLLRSTALRTACRELLRSGSRCNGTTWMPILPYMPARTIGKQPVALQYGVAKLRNQPFACTETARWPSHSSFTYQLCPFLAQYCCVCVRPRVEATQPNILFFPLCDVETGRRQAGPLFPGSKWRHCVKRRSGTSNLCYFSLINGPTQENTPPH